MTELHTTQKGRESVDKFLMRLKNIRDQLASVGERISNNDLMIDVLSGLPVEFEMIRTMILARDTTLSLKDFRAQLLVAEGSIESKMQSLLSFIAAMCVQGEGSNSQRYQGCEHGESSNTQGMHRGYNGEQFGDSFQGGSGFLGNGNNRNGNTNYNTRNNSNNFKKFGNGNNNFKNSSSRFHNRNGNWGNNNHFGNGNNSYSGNGKAHQSGGNGYFGNNYGNGSSFSGNGSLNGGNESSNSCYSKSNWAGNTNLSLLYHQSVKYAQEEDILHQTVITYLIMGMYRVLVL
ncbi:N66 matrix protein-like [Pyrus x bretschneideri]|uniref:N66 matrix protein-like n=1 Tax=Pyrus x bretschneideri TaxID=225117 RepID=UPI00202F435B|nr:N66 matrix protein-like [Pyrus x bretschneideri]